MKGAINGFSALVSHNVRWLDISSVVAIHCSRPNWELGDQISVCSTTQTGLLILPNPKIRLFLPVYFLYTALYIISSTNP
jgi:hypothetical protein